MLGVTVLIFLNSCTKLIEINAPTTSINTENVYSNSESAISALTGIYAEMSRGGGGFNTGGFATGPQSISLLAGLTCR